MWVRAMIIKEKQAGFDLLNFHQTLRQFEPVKGLANPDEGDWWSRKAKEVAEKEEEGKVGEEEGVSKLVPTTQCGICGAGAPGRNLAQC